jgi:hypothetical protein
MSLFAGLLGRSPVWAAGFSSCLLVLLFKVDIRYAIGVSLVTVIATSSIAYASTQAPFRFGHHETPLANTERRRRTPMANRSRTGRSVVIVHPT